MTAVAVIDAGGANFGSVCYALQRLGVQPHIARDAESLAGAQRVILPGVGVAAQAMRLLHERGFALLLVDARCHGQSDGDTFASLPRFAEDIDAALAWLAGQPESMPPGWASSAIRSAPVRRYWRPRAAPICAPWSAWRLSPIRRR